MMIEGRTPFGEHQTYYRVTGDLGSGRTPLVVLHGGPGSTHDYLLRLTDLAAGGFPVIHYDQLGNGLSTHLPDRPAGFWTVSLFLAELDNLLRYLGIGDDYVLLGQSWGGMLAAEHAVLRPGGLRGLVIADSTPSMPLWLEEMDRLRAELPPEVQDVLRRHEKDGTTGSLAYLRATRVFYDRHVCRLDPWPGEVAATFRKIAADPTVYSAMNGPNEFHVIGTLRDWTIEDRLPAIDVPTLLVSGRHDEATPKVMAPFHERIPGARWEIFEESSHLPHLEEPDRFDAVLKAFLAELDRSS
jgi:L-proline amide hydrolase